MRTNALPTKLPFRALHEISESRKRIVLCYRIEERGQTTANELTAFSGNRAECLWTNCRSQGHRDQCGQLLCSVLFSWESIQARKLHLTPSQMPWRYYVRRYFFLALTSRAHRFSAQLPFSIPENSFQSSSALALEAGAAIPGLPPTPKLPDFPQARTQALVSQPRVWAS